MTAILRSTPPRDYVNQIRPLAWLRLGKMVVFSVLAGLAVAGGMAFPGGEAEAQAYGGYTYTQRVCQEYGQQPRWYNVREGQAAYNGGNSDRGWLIVLERGGGIDSGAYTFNDARSVGGANNASLVLGIARNVITPPHGSVEDPDNPVGSRITATDGTSGFVQNFGRWVVIDRNDNGELDAGDMFFNSGLYDYEERRYRQTRAPAPYGAQYIRWAHMAWCR